MLDKIMELARQDSRFLQNIHRVSKKLCQCYFLNNSVKHWPTLIIFGVQHREETWRK